MEAGKNGSSSSPSPTSRDKAARNKQKRMSPGGLASLMFQLVPSPRPAATARGRSSSSKSPSPQRRSVLDRGGGGGLLSQQPQQGKRLDFDDRKDFDDVDDDEDDFEVKNQGDDDDDDDDYRPGEDDNDDSDDDFHDSFDEFNHKHREVGSTSKLRYKSSTIWSKRNAGKDKNYSSDSNNTPRRRRQKREREYIQPSFDDTVLAAGRSRSSPKKKTTKREMDDPFEFEHQEENVNDRDDDEEEEEAMFSSRSPSPQQQRRQEEKKNVRRSIDGSSNDGIDRRSDNHSETSSISQKQHVRRRGRPGRPPGPRTPKYVDPEERPLYTPWMKRVPWNAPPMSETDPELNKLLLKSKQKKSPKSRKLFKSSPSKTSPSKSSNSGEGNRNTSTDHVKKGASPASTKVTMKHRRTEHRQPQNDTAFASSFSSRKYLSSSFARRKKKPQSNMNHNNSMQRLVDDVKHVSTERELDDPSASSSSSSPLPSSIQAQEKQVDNDGFNNNRKMLASRPTDNSGSLGPSGPCQEKGASQNNVTILSAELPRSSSRRKPSDRKVDMYDTKRADIMQALPSEQMKVSEDSDDNATAEQTDRTLLASRDSSKTVSVTDTRSGQLSLPTGSTSQTETEDDGLTVFDRHGRPLALDEISNGGAKWFKLDHLGQISDYHGFERKYTNAFKINYNKSTPLIRNEISSILESAAGREFVTSIDEESEVEEAIYLVGLSKRKDLASVEKEKKRSIARTLPDTACGLEIDESLPLRVMFIDGDDDGVSKIASILDSDSLERKALPSSVARPIEDADDYLDERDAIEYPDQKRPSRTTMLSTQKKKSIDALKELSNNLSFIEAYNVGFGMLPEKKKIGREAESGEKYDTVVSDLPPPDGCKAVSKTNIPKKRKRSEPSQGSVPPKKKTAVTKSKSKISAKASLKTMKEKPEPYRYTPVAFDPKWDPLDSNVPVGQYLTLQQQIPSFVTLKIPRSKKGTISKDDIDRIISREGDIEYLCKDNVEMLKSHKKVARSYRRLADQEKLEKMEYEEKCQHAHAQHLMFSKKIRRNKDAEKEEKGFLSRPIIFIDGDDDKAPNDNGCCAYGDDCPVCSLKDVLRDDPTGTDGDKNLLSIILRPSWRRVPIEEIDVPSEEDQEEESLKTASLLKLAEVGGSMAFVEEYNQGFTAR